MHFHVITLFPEMIEAAAKAGVVGQAITNGKLGLTAVSPRKYTSNVHQTIDDRPFGGGDGMIMMAEPLSQALTHLEMSGKTKVIHVSPRGVPFTDKKARELAAYDHLVLISTRYGGADQRFLNEHVDEEISLGDFILTGGELAVLVMIDAIGRLQPGILGNEASSQNESFAGSLGLLENPQYTRPREWNGQAIPKPLLSGDHAKISAFQDALTFLVTAERRPDLLEAAVPNLTRSRVQKALETLKGLEESGEFTLCGLNDAGLIRTTLEQVIARLPEEAKKKRGKPT
jgi:tRNA (guanine37-N1)-methyltransferase